MRFLVRQLLNPVFNRALGRSFLKYTSLTPWQLPVRNSICNFPKQPLYRQHFQTLQLLKLTPWHLPIFSGLKSLSLAEKEKENEAEKDDDHDDEKPEKPKRRVPKLILLQNPLQWLMIKIDFKVLRSIWDPGFVEKDFRFGTKQAISKITQIVSAGDYTELNGLLTKAARLSLLRDLDKNWTTRRRTLLSLDKDDIQISSPRKVNFIRIADKKYCDVDMAFLALKWVPLNHIDALILTEIFARFHREYTPHTIPEWTIAYFKVTKFEVIKR